MNTTEKNEIEKLITDRKKTHLFLSQNSPVYNSFIDLEQKTYIDKKLDKKHKILIGIGISVIKNCESCMEWHINEAIKSGASKDEILEAIEVAYKMGGAPAVVASRFALKVLEYYNA